MGPPTSILIRNRCPSSIGKHSIPNNVGIATGRTTLRRAAAERARRVERIARRVIGDGAGVMTDAHWAGTFHGIGMSR
jgi:hypothetical protein